MPTRRTYSKPSDAQLRTQLSPLEYEVTQRDATEPAFRNRFWDHHEAGLYVDVTTGEPLFSSTDKFDSGTGWPSFTKPLEPERVLAKHDVSHGMRRIEARSSAGDAHLGHVFEDGPRPLGTRYCINSASLRFIAVSELESAGYAQYLPLFGRGSQAPVNATAIENSCAIPIGDQQPGCQSTLETAIFAGGCFWGMEALLLKVPGVLETEVGYTGGRTPNPSYEDVVTGSTGHAESVRVVFDPKQISYEDLLERWFFRIHDPTTKGRQGNDVGSQYRSAIFVGSALQRATAERVMQRIEASGKWRAPLVTEIVEAGPFTPAEEHHQKYLVKNPRGYSCHYLRD